MLEEAAYEQLKLLENKQLGTIQIELNLREKNFKHFRSLSLRKYLGNINRLAKYTTVFQWCRSKLHESIPKYINGD